MNVIDPVCGMDINHNHAAGKSEYQGKIYYFCSYVCKKAFDKEADKYIGKTKERNNHDM